MMSVDDNTINSPVIDALASYFVKQGYDISEEALKLQEQYNNVQNLKMESISIGL